MIDLLRQRLADYDAIDARQEEQALEEILQEVVLYALWRADFFDVAAFQGAPVCDCCMACDASRRISTSS